MNVAEQTSTMEPCQPSSIVPDYGVFLQCGSLFSRDPEYLILKFNNVKVSVPKSNFFVNGMNCSDDEWNLIPLGASIFFDAFPKLNTRAKNRKIRATCGWVGGTPDLNHRFPFRFGVNKMPPAVVVQSGSSKLILVQIVDFPSPELAACKFKNGSFITLSLLAKDMLVGEDGSHLNIVAMEDVFHVGDWVALHSKTDFLQSAPLQFFIVPQNNLSGSWVESIAKNSVNSTSVERDSPAVQEVNASLSETRAKANEELSEHSLSLENMTGQFAHLKDPDTGVIMYKNHELIFHEKDCFFENLKWSDLSDMHNIQLKFQAIKLETSEPSDLPLYKILCVWNAQRPSVRSRWRRLNTCHDQNLVGTVLQGTVVSFALPKIAFVSVPVNDGTVCVCVTHHSFNPHIPKSTYIYSALKIGDDVRMTVTFTFKLFSGKQAIILTPKMKGEQNNTICPGPDTRLEFSKVKCKVKSCDNDYTDGIGTLAMKLSEDEAVFFVFEAVENAQGNSTAISLLNIKRKTSKSKKSKNARLPYAVYMKKSDIFVNGIPCQNLRDLNEEKRFRILSFRETENLPNGALLCGVSHKGICGISLDCEVLNMCQHYSPVSLDSSVHYNGKVKQYLCFNILLVECTVGDEIINVLLKSDAVVTMTESKQFIGCHLKIGDDVTMKLDVFHRDGFRTFQASIAAKGKSAKLSGWSLISEELASDTLSAYTEECFAKDDVNSSSADQSHANETSKQLSTYLIGSGKFTHCLSASQGIVTSETGEKILVSTDYLFYNGEPCNNLTISDLMHNFVIDFEAVSLAADTKTHSFIANCAWIKRKYSIADLLDKKLHYCKEPLQHFDFSSTYNAVVQDMIPPKFSIVCFNPPGRGFIYALLPVQALNLSEDSKIQNLIQVGDSLSIKVQEKDVGGKSIMFVSKATLLTAAQRESCLPDCFSRLLQMSGKVVELFNDFEGEIEVDILALRVKFFLRDVVFWNSQDAERDKGLSDFMPVGTLLMFNACKEITSKGSVFRATEVWKPFCFSNP